MVAMKMCTIFDVQNKVDKYGRVKVFTDKRGIRNFQNGNAFYIWTEEYANPDDFCLIVFEKDISVDSNDLVYVVDGCDVEVV
jgi:hypothetical protein